MYVYHPFKRIIADNFIIFSDFYSSFLHYQYSLWNEWLFFLENLIKFSSIRSIRKNKGNALTSVLVESLVCMKDQVYINNRLLLYLSHIRSSGDEPEFSLRH